MASFSGAILTGLVATYLFLCTLLRWTQDPREPPPVDTALPFVSPLISMGRKGSQYWTGPSGEFHSLGLTLQQSRYQHFRAGVCPYTLCGFQESGRTSSTLPPLFNRAAPEPHHLLLAYSGASGQNVNHCWPENLRYHQNRLC